MIAHNLCNNTGDISLMCRTSLLRMLKGRYEKEKSDRKKREEGEKENVEDMKRRARVKMMMKRNDDEEDDEEPRRRRATGVVAEVLLNAGLGFCLLIAASIKVPSIIFVRLAEAARCFAPFACRQNSSSQANAACPQGCRHASRGYMHSPPPA